MTTSPETTRTVSVNLGDRSYEILIGGGLLRRSGEEVARRLPGVRAAIVTDDNVAERHANALVESLEAGGIATTIITIPPGERSKSFDVLQQVVDGVLSAKLERGDVVIALGGGVVGDLVGA
jgi:3-dehydroquinate synthase